MILENETKRIELSLHSAGGEDIDYVEWARLSNPTNGARIDGTRIQKNIYEKYSMIYFIFCRK